MWLSRLPATYLSGDEVLFDGRNYPYTNGTCSSLLEVPQQRLLTI